MSNSISCLYIYAISCLPNIWPDKIYQAKQPEALHSLSFPLTILDLTLSLFVKANGVYSTGKSLLATLAGRKFNVLVQEGKLYHCRPQIWVRRQYQS